MSKSFYSFLIILLANPIFNSIAQPRKGEFIKASLGIGLCAASDDSDITGSGFYAQGEYVWGLTSWFGVRPYAGMIIASSDEPTEPGMPQYSIKSNAFLLGTKFRLAAPIPFIAPYMELGIGMSVGSFQTYTPYTDLRKSGAQLHVPFSFGLALGRRHNIEVEFTYYFHPAAEQFSGAAAVGFTFPLNAI